MAIRISDIALFPEDVETDALHRMTRRRVLETVGAGALLVGMPYKADAAPTDVGQWSPVYGWRQVAVHLHLLPNGKILTYTDTYPDPTKPDQSIAHIMEIPTGGTPREVRAVPNDEVNLFCAGHCFLPDGRLFVAGGQKGNYKNYYRGIVEAAIFDYRDDTWHDTYQYMQGPRWYPSAICLANGEVLVVGGTTVDKSTHNLIPETWLPGRGWRRLTGATQKVPLYAWIFQAPNGRVFMAGHEGQTRWLDTAGDGKWTLGPRRRVGSRYDGSAVMYAPNRILVMGGSKPPTATAEIIDLNGSQTWQSTDPMQHSRRFLNATILPDGKVLVTGGKGGNSYQPIYPAEMWDPATGRWATMASMQVPRLYHSTALLLPDGRVLSAGGGRSGEPDHKDAELFSPPYLFKGTRPSISSAPASVGYGQAFFVGTPDASKVATVAFIGISSVTHTFNTGQRRIAHVPTQTAGGIMVTAPASRNIAPPGHYHLFLLTAEGVPSVSKIVRIG